MGRSKPRLASAARHCGLQGADGCAGSVHSLGHSCVNLDVLGQPLLQPPFPNPHPHLFPPTFSPVVTHSASPQSSRKPTQAPSMGGVTLGFSPASTSAVCWSTLNDTSVRLAAAHQRGDQWKATRVMAQRRRRQAGKQAGRPRPCCAAQHARPRASASPPTCGGVACLLPHQHQQAVKGGQCQEHQRRQALCGENKKPAGVGFCCAAAAATCPARRPCSSTALRNLPAAG